jgi:hypothetical protein
MKTTVLAIVLITLSAIASDADESIEKWTNGLTGTLSVVRLEGVEKKTSIGYALKWSVSGTLTPLKQRVPPPWIRIIALVESELDGLKSVKRIDERKPIIPNAFSEMIDASQVPKVIRFVVETGTIVTKKRQNIKVLAYKAEIKWAVWTAPAVAAFQNQNDAVLEKKGIPIDWWDELKHGPNF